MDVLAVDQGPAPVMSEVAGVGPYREWQYDKRAVLQAGNED